MLSEEQLSIVNTIHDEKCHVKVDACPGSGKSTLIYHVVRAKPESSTAIVLTYNRSLADSTRDKLSDCPKTMVYTFHGLASSLFGRVIANDFDLVSLFDTVPDVSWEFSNFDLLVIDEAQDLRSIYVRLVVFLIQQCTNLKELTIMIVGDVNQLLYNFYNITSADSRYLLHFDKVIDHDRKWMSKHLSQSFRLTGPIVNFTNHVKPSPVECVSHQPIGDPPVVIFVCDIYRDAANLILEMISKSGYEKGDIFILCPSLNNRSPAIKIVHKLMEANVGVNIMRGQQKRKKQGKVGLMTFCGAKGLEADFVIVLNTRPMIIPVDNTMFVAMTRAKRELVILQHYQQTSVQELDSVRRSMLQKDLRIIVKRTIVDIRIPHKSRKIYIPSLDSMFAFMDVVDICRLYQHVDTRIVCEDSSGVRFPEDHRDLAVRAIEFALEFYSTSKLPRLFQNQIKHLESFANRGQEIYLKLKLLIEKATRIITCPERGMHITHVLTKLEGFAMAALVVECMVSYIDKIDQTFEWVLHKAVYVRCQYFLTFLQSSHMKWNVSFIKNGYSYKPLAKNMTDNYLLHHATGVKITPSDILTAITGVEISNMSKVYICNVTSGKIIHVWLKNTQPTVSFLDLVIECKNRKRVRSDDKDFFGEFQ